MICVFASSLVLTVTVEAPEEGEGDEIHVHPGGQGFWIARMIDRLGEAVALIAPLGGESGKVISGLIEESGVSLMATDRQGASPVYIHDRRSGERESLAEQLEPGLSRHETDDLYSRTLEAALGAETMVVTGRYGAGGIPESFYARLGADLSTLETHVVGDLHGPELDAFLKEGRIELLKVSTDDLLADGAIDDDRPAQIGRAIKTLVDKGVRGVVVSGGGDGSSVGQIDGTWYQIEQPSLQAADHRGSGDSMTAGLAVGLHRGLEASEILQMSASAGAANVVRRGLGNADADLTGALHKTVTITEIESPIGN